MDSRFRRFLTALTLPWLLPLSLAPVPLLAMGEPPPRLAEIPLEVPVGDLGRNERLPDLLRSRYRPAPAGAFPVQRAGPWAIPSPCSPASRPRSAGGWPTRATPGACTPASI